MTPRLVRSANGRQLKTTEAWPEGATYTIQATALLFGKKPRTIYNVLNENAARLSRPKYRQLYRHKQDHRLYRILTEADIVVIRQVFCVRVK
jgi:hypothetical protein